MKLVRVVAVAGFGLLALALPASPETDQWNFRTDYPVDSYLTPLKFPCLVETIHVTGTFEERWRVLFRPSGGYSWQVQQTTRNLTAVGLETGETYQYSGPLSWVENGWTDNPWKTWYPVEWTLHNISHYVGPGQLPNLYFRSLWHITLDRATGEVKVEVLKEDVLCR